MGAQVRPATVAGIEGIAELHADSWRRNYRGAFPDGFLDGDLVAERRAVWTGRLTRPAPDDRTLVAATGDGPVVGSAVGSPSPSDSRHLRGSSRPAGGVEPWGEHPIGPEGVAMVRHAPRRSRAVLAGCIAAAAMAAGVAVAVRTPTAVEPQAEDEVEVEAQVARPMGFRGGGVDERRSSPAADPAAFVFRQGGFGRSTFTRLADVPGAQLTAHLGINDRQQVTGVAIDADAVPDPVDGGFTTGHGFVQDRRGRTVRTVRFDVAGAAITLPSGIDDRGDVVGVAVDADSPSAPGAVHGFVRDRHGDIETFEVPFFHLHNAADINDSGQIVGYYDDAGFSSGGGFLRERDGTFVDIRYPGAVYTDVHGIDDRGQAVGSYLEAGAALNPDGTVPRGVVHGFTWQDGRFRTFDVPGSTSTQAFGINDRGQIVGGYRDAAGRQHGFLRDGRRYRTLDVPGGGGNVAVGIDDRGDVVLPDPRTVGTLPVAP